MGIERRSGLKALLEIGLMLAPGIPASIWIWPKITGTAWAAPAQILVYAYFLMGALLIGLRRWNLSQLGINRHGIVLSLLSGGALLLGRILIVLGTNLAIGLPSVSPSQLLFDFLFYVFLVGAVEEFLFRGLIYHALKQVQGTRLAIWGSALVFGLYHVGWQGVIGGVGTALIGLIFGVIRWRAGGILGLILVHGLIDFVAVETYQAASLPMIEQAQINNPAWAILGALIVAAVPLILWKGIAPAGEANSSERSALP
jgi:membrane protease YdiL (CAAX protease family)